MYIAYNCKHLINERRYNARTMQKPVTILLQEVKGERTRKRLQMAVIYHTLDQGQPMLEYESMKPLLQFLETRKLGLPH
jgi:hypothetical protein